MKIVLIGSGNVATVFGRLLKHAEHEIVQVMGRNATNANELADASGAAWSNDITKLDKDADFYIIAVSDAAVESIAKTIALKDKIVVHTSGAVSKEVLKTVTKNYGVLYPLQSLRKETTYHPVIPLLIDAANAATQNTIEEIATAISNRIQVANDIQRLKLHIAAVAASNFSNHLFALVQEYCKKEAVSFDILLPLIQETANRLNDFDARQVQTGPAIRGDNATIQKHLEMLAPHHQLHEIYKTITESITSFYRKP